jgi:hypothetical protein
VAAITVAAAMGLADVMTIKTCEGAPGLYAGGERRLQRSWA